MLTDGINMDQTAELWINEKATAKEQEKLCDWNKQQESIKKIQNSSTKISATHEDPLENGKAGIVTEKAGPTIKSKLVD
jgi:hypothetical protein